MLFKFSRIITVLAKIREEKKFAQASVAFSFLSDFFATRVNYEKHALLVSRVIAMLAKSAYKHAIFLATCVNKKGKCFT